MEKRLVLLFENQLNYFIKLLYLKKDRWDAGIGIIILFIGKEK